MEKLFLVEIDSLDNEKGCFASNKHFSEFFGLSKGRCTQIIKELEKKKMIKISYEREGKQITKRVIKVVNKLSTPVNKLNKGSKKTKQGYLENDEESNTSNSNTSNSNKPHSPKKSKYGDAENVLLTDEEYKKLKDRFPSDYEERINNLSYYIASKGAKYKSHYMTILAWARKDSNKSKKGSACESYIN